MRGASDYVMLDVMKIVASPGGCALQLWQKCTPFQFQAISGRK